MEKFKKKKKKIKVSKKKETTEHDETERISGGWMDG
jgi:hypothetical protein